MTFITIDPNFYVYINALILIIGIIVCSIILSISRKDVKNIDSYNWKKFSYLTETRKVKKYDGKERNKIRIKGFNKGAGYVKEDIQLPSSLSSKSTIYSIKEEGRFLKPDDVKNLQDMLNYAATIGSKSNEDESVVDDIFRKSNSKGSNSNISRSETTHNQNINERINQKILDIIEK
jgi:hypothetical protein